MAEFSFPFDSDFVNGVADRPFNSHDDRMRYGSLVTNGIYPIPSNNLQVVWNSGMTVNVKQGKAWNSGAFYFSLGDTAFTLKPANALNDRIDVIVLRFNLIEREVKLKLLEGVPSTNPIASAISRTSEIYDLKLAEIRVKRAVASITQADIKDTRLIKSECGIVTGVVDQLDATTLYNQYEALFKQKGDQFYNEFETWFNSIKGQVGDDMATKLTLEIANLKLDKQDKKITDDTTGKKYKLGINNGLVYFEEV